MGNENQIRYSKQTVSFEQSYFNRIINFGNQVFI